MVDTTTPCTVRLHYFVVGDASSHTTDIPEIKGGSLGRGDGPSRFVSSVRTYTYDLPHAGLRQKIITNDEVQVWTCFVSFSLNLKILLRE